MILSAGCEYGIQALLYLEHQQGHFVPVARIAKETGISPSFLSKVLQKLVQCGILVSEKGAGGGVALARPSSEITLLDIIEALDGLQFQTRCVLGFPNCNDTAPCPVHRYWGAIRDSMTKMFASKNLHDFAREMTPAVQKRLRQRTPGHRT